MSNPGVEALSRVLGSPRNLDVAWTAPKEPLPASELAVVLEEGLREREWFVTGRILPQYFADNFVFKDPDVSVQGVRAYSEGVSRLFADESRAEILNCSLRGDTFGVTWRLSGGARLGPFVVRIKPYIVYTDFLIEDGLVSFQEDRFSIPSWDILLSAVAPWLPFLAPPAPPVVVEEEEE
ncbi:hypothetical protein CTAYLR_003121 [Chrysophaeum taylorii]|uniref:SnoaL-like domain-containing protein n=1 Tax=Chrysophaeum taylorii TaxID=2483200 RepID=A0AAD7XRS0_9STRA|nr:hypothetical protein CTAYLR_003121 [Chrysophaeum taylorii]